MLCRLHHVWGENDIAAEENQEHKKNWEKNKWECSRNRWEHCTDTNIHVYGFIYLNGAKKRKRKKITVQLLAHVMHTEKTNGNVNAANTNRLHFDRLQCCILIGVFHTVPSLPLLQLFWFWKMQMHYNLDVRLLHMVVHELAVVQCVFFLILTAQGSNWWHLHFVISFSLSLSHRLFQHLCRTFLPSFLWVSSFIARLVFFISLLF